MELASLRRRDAALRKNADPQTLLAQFRFPEYAEAIARIRAAVPEDEPLYLLDLGENEAYFVHFDLAPRRMVYVGTPARKDRETFLRTQPHLKARWAVVASMVPPGPVLLPVDEVFGPAP